ncbi:MAG: hypothetical protein QM726_07965 [Chitinophagaceae bacterium]
MTIILSDLFAQNNYDNIVTDEKRIDVLLSKVNAAQANADERTELHNIAIRVQNNGQELDEKYRQYKKALATIDKAIVLFTALGDTLDIANNRKYKGYLLGRMEKYKEAKNETKIAIELYQLKKMSAGVAVSQFDIARIYEFENKTDSAIYYASVACNYWKQKDVDLRVLIANNMLVSLYLKKDQPEKAIEVQHESGMIINKPGMHWQAVVDFYYTSMLLYRNTNDDATANRYKQFYIDKVNSLRGEGIAARSYYESDR